MEPPSQQPSKFQEDLCGIEASTASGLSQRLPRFQMDPWAVEASASPSPITCCSSFRWIRQRLKHSKQAEKPSTAAFRWIRRRLKREVRRGVEVPCFGFRWTRRRLKDERRWRSVHRSPVFQTDPWAVEAPRGRLTGRGFAHFRWTLGWLKLPATFERLGETVYFRRTRERLKRCPNVGAALERLDFRRTFERLKCDLDVRILEPDVGFRRTRGQLKRRLPPAPPVQHRVSDGRLGG
jgi:hypothetical protein